MLILVLLAPTTVLAAANGGGGWWESMSGPGPWWGPSLFLSPICFNDFFRERGNRCGIKDEYKTWVNLGGSVMFTGEETGDQVAVRNPTLTAVNFEPSFDFNAANLFNKVPFLVGFGAGVHWFTGTDGNFWRGSIEPRVSLVFFAEKSVYMQVRFTAKYFFKGFTSADFGDPMGTFDTGGGDWVPTVAVIFGF